MDAIDTEVHLDGALLSEILGHLSKRAPLRSWRDEAVAALAAACSSQIDNTIERAKAARLERHLFAGPSPDDLVSSAPAPGRRADRLRADLADLATPGAGLYLLEQFG